MLFYSFIFISTLNYVKPYAHGDNEIKPITRMIAHKIGLSGKPVRNVAIKC